MDDQPTDLELRSLADLIVQHRNRAHPDGEAWTRTGVTAALRRLHTADTATLLAIGQAAAGDAQADTPAAIGWPKYRTAETTILPNQGAREERCYICGNIRSRCLQLHDDEIRKGVPDPHDFETAEQAEANAVPMPDDVRALIAATLERQNVNAELARPPERDQRAYEAIQARDAEHRAAAEAERQRTLDALIAERDPT